MFGDIGWAEMLLIGVVALVVIGPEDLPQMFRQIGRFTAKIRAMGRDFSRAMEQAAAETGVKDMAKDIKAATSVGGLGLDKVKAAADKFERWDPIKGNVAKPAAKPLVPAPIPESPKVDVPKVDIANVEAAYVAAATSDTKTADTKTADTINPDAATSAPSKASPTKARKSVATSPTLPATADQVKTARAPRKKKSEADPS